MIPVLQFENVGVRLSAARELLSDVHLVLGPGEAAVIAGARGSGKSLLCALATAERAPDRGRVSVLGETGPWRRRDWTRLRRRVGWCSERPEVLPELSGADNVALPLRIAGAPGARAREDAAELLAWLGSDDPLRRAGDAGPEETARIGVAQALVGRPALAVIDVGLAGLLAERVATLIGEMRRAGTAFLVTGEDHALAGRLPGCACYRLAGGRLERA